MAASSMYRHSLRQCEQLWTAQASHVVCASCSPASDLPQVLSLSLQPAIEHSGKKCLGLLDKLQEHLTDTFKWSVLTNSKLYS